jgi:hypothetical protein
VFVSPVYLSCKRPLLFNKLLFKKKKRVKCCDASDSFEVKSDWLYYNSEPRYIQRKTGSCTSCV